MKAITLEIEKAHRGHGGQAWLDGDDRLFCVEPFRRAFHIPPGVRRVSMRVSLRKFKGSRVVRVQNRADQSRPFDGYYYCTHYYYTLHPDITPGGELLRGAVRWIEKNIRPLPPDGPVLTLWVSVTSLETQQCRLK